MASVNSYSRWWAGLLTFITVLAFWCMNYIASEIEQPFGEDANDLPIPDMMRDMNASLWKLIQPLAQTPPSFAYEPDKHRHFGTITQAEARGGNQVSQGVIPWNAKIRCDFAKNRGRSDTSITSSVNSSFIYAGKKGQKQRDPWSAK